jgi:hypothetical protein
VAKARATVAAASSLIDIGTSIGDREAEFPGSEPGRCLDVPEERARSIFPGASPGLEQPAPHRVRRTGKPEEAAMTAEKNEWLEPNTDEEAEIRHLVENTDLSPQQARQIVAKHGLDRRKLLEVARTMKAES